MKKRLVLTSLVAVGCACPIFAAMAEDFPTDGYMLENKTYDNAATYANMGVYDGGVTATAEYEDTLYQIAAGTYLPAGSEVADQCPANSYCPGITTTYDESAAQGVWSCPDDYPNSDAGSSTDTQCYTACTVDMVDKATAVSGNDYNGAGVDTCVATVCEGGYHVDDSIEVVEQTPLIDVDYTVAGSDYGHINFNGSDNYRADRYGLTENNTWATKFDYGVVYGRASCQPTPHDPGVEYLWEKDWNLRNGKISPDTVRSELTPLVGAAKANYMADVVAGIADGSLGQEDYLEAKYVVFGSPKDASYNTTDEGIYCYCQITGYRASGATETIEVDSASAPWVYSYDVGGEAFVCANGCAFRCANDPMYSSPLRGALYGALSTGVAGTCAANEITISWTGATADAIAANNAGMCTYDGEIRTPKSAITIPGKTFVGWKFDKPAQE